MKETTKASTVLGGLLKIKEAATGRDNTLFLFVQIGICHNLKQFIGGISYDIVPKYAIGWPEHSGVKNFPVPLLDYTDTNFNLWIGKHGAARLRLLDYLIKRMEELGDSEISVGED